MTDATQHSGVAMTEAELEAAISPVSMRNYRMALRHDKVKILAWVPLLQRMSDEDFVVECASKILDSAIMNGYRGNVWGTHAKADICQDEAKRRHMTAGHDEDCRGDNLYSKGYSAALKSQGHKTRPPTPCTCGHEEE